MAVMGAQSAGTSDFYRTHAQQYWNSTVHLDVHQLYEPFVRCLQKGARILDAGCGSGRDTKALLDRGYRITAIDASPELVALATAFSGHDCRILRFQDMQFQNEFDGIWACASLLHTPRSEMSDVFPRFIRALKPGGVMYLSLKEGAGERIAEDGRFFSYYTADSFREILASFPTVCEIAFWKAEEIRSQTHRQPWLNFLLKRMEQMRA
jgi:SAM-dependent methyltransferase